MIATRFMRSDKGARHRERYKQKCGMLYSVFQDTKKAMEGIDLQMKHF